jgi:hypothetical protein
MAKPRAQNPILAKIHQLERGNRRRRTSNHCRKALGAATHCS